MSKNAPVAIVKCLECGKETILRRNQNQRFYTYCSAGHEHRYDNDTFIADRVPGFVRIFTEDHIETINRIPQEIGGKSDDIREKSINKFNL